MIINIPNIKIKKVSKKLLLSYEKFLSKSLANINDVKKINDKVSSKQLKYIILIGIGGSNLGAKAVYDAFYGYFDNIEPDRFPKIIFFDTVDPEFSEKLLKFIKPNIKKPEEIIINVVSKSGTTLETVFNYEFLLKNLVKIFGEKIKNRIVITADKSSKLYAESKNKGISVLEIPESVGGRYSIFSAAGLFPLAAAKINIDDFIKGARSAKLNSALSSSLFMFSNYKSGRKINDIFIFHPELESLGKWQRQLLAESLGKNGEGITPLVSIGSTDLHSVIQLYLDGPKDKFTTFIYTKKNKNPRAKMMNAIFEATKKSYSKKKIPFMEIMLDDISPKSLGEFMQFKIMETTLLAKLMKVNAFDQPAVELYKSEIKKY